MHNSVSYICIFKNKLPIKYYLQNFYQHNRIKYNIGTLGKEHSIIPVIRVSYPVCGLPM
jgi:hypothetical protein